jgi:FkbH-like protein
MKLVEALEELEHTVPPQSPPLNIQLACGFTPLHFLTFLNARLRREFPGHKIQIGTGVFGDLPGNLERLEKANADAVVSVIEWQDLDPRLGVRRLGGWTPRQLIDISRNVRDSAARVADSHERIAHGKTVALALPTLPLPPVAFTPGWQAGSFEFDIRGAVGELANRLARLDGIRIVSVQRLDRISPPSARYDVRSELSAGFPYSLSHADALAGLLARIIRNPSPLKGLITDLDDTLWTGILGEVGVESISWDLDHHAQKHGLYQQLLASISEAGILIAAASKNDPALVEEAFRAAKPILTRKRIFPMEINWGPKSESVARILRAWNVGADSVVFVDDSPLDLAEVKAAHPEIECLLFPRDDDRAAYQLLEDLRDLFGKQALSQEDEIRLESIRASYAAGASGPSSQSTPERFLKEAGGKLTLSFHKDSTDPRALELINKTNQFNLNGRRHTEASWKRYLSEPQVFLTAASYEDKFGSLGKIAVITGRRDGRNLFVDHWVMSCRAFSRRIEHGCLLRLFEKSGAEEAAFDFASTPRNGPLQEFFAGLLGASPEKPFSIRKEQLADRCLPVYLEILEAADE